MMLGQNMKIFSFAAESGASGACAVPLPLMGRTWFGDGVGASLVAAAELLVCRIDMVAREGVWWEACRPRIDL